jgi:hypothetical protein
MTDWGRIIIGVQRIILWYNNNCDADDKKA